MATSHTHWPNRSATSSAPPSSSDHGLTARGAGAGAAEAVRSRAATSSREAESASGGCVRSSRSSGERSPVGLESSLM